MPENKYKTDKVILRNYPKVIFFWPLFLTSFIAWCIQIIYDTILPLEQEPLGWLGIFWFIVFFTNLFVVSFDVSSSKFFILLLIVVVGVLLIIFLVVPYVSLPALPGGEFNPGLTTIFYFLMWIIFAFILGFILLGVHFNYYKIERNEIYHNKGIFSSAERYPVKSLRIRKEIADVFEYFVLRAGSLTLLPGKADEVITLNTVLNINKRVKQLDYLLSDIGVEPDELDNI